MSFFDEGRDDRIANHIDVSGFANALQNRQTFVVPAPSPRMVQAITRQSQQSSSSPLKPPPLTTQPMSFKLPAAAGPSSSSSSSSSSPQSAFSPLDPKDLPPLVSQPSTLILDIRPHGQYHKSRLHGAINLAVPSTLLRRPAFSLDKLCSMLPNATDKEAFQLWRTAKDIIVYDADASTLSDGSNVQSLLTKLKAAAPPGRLCYVFGGMNAIAACGVAGLADTSSPDAELTDGEDPATSKNELLSVRGLSLAAFQQGSTTTAGQRPGSASVNGAFNLGSDLNAQGAPAPMTTRMAAANPFYDNIRQHRELSGGISERIPLYLPKAIRKRAQEVPFPWLRDIINWSGGSWAIKASAAVLAEGDKTSDNGAGSVAGTASTWSGRASSKRRAKEAAEEGTEALAMQFYRIELGEQRRLQGLMDHHSRQTTNANKRSLAYGTNFSAGEVKPEEVGISVIHTLRTPRPFCSVDITMPDETIDLHDGPATPTLEQPGHVEVLDEEHESSSGSEEYFPFSITAGVEKGSKNRYRNIWPFDHARVRLHRHCSDDGSDYINASYIQPRGTQRQYIATQGPLPSTYNDFWTLVWEQNVRILAMLTKRKEGNQTKCGLYWKDGTYGSLKLKLVKEEGGTDGERAEENNPEGVDAPTGGFDFGVTAQSKAKKARRAKADMAREFGKDLKPKNAGACPGPVSMKVVGQKSSSSDPTSSSEDDDDDSIIRREFTLTDLNHPEWPTRSIVQLQYVGWPDVNVPPTPKNLLKLINEINVLHQEYQDSGVIGVNEKGMATHLANGNNTTSDSRAKSHIVSRAAAVVADQKLREGNEPDTQRRQANSQTLVHCSAGVGRTGAFIVIDSILDAVRRESQGLMEGAVANDPSPMQELPEEAEVAFGGGVGAEAGARTDGYVTEAMVAADAMSDGTDSFAAFRDMPAHFSQHRLNRPIMASEVGSAVSSRMDAGGSVGGQSDVHGLSSSSQINLPTLSLMSLASPSKADSAGPPGALGPPPPLMTKPKVPGSVTGGSLFQRRLKSQGPESAMGGSATDTPTTLPSLSFSSLIMPTARSTMPSSPGTNYRTDSTPGSPKSDASSYDFTKPRKIKVPRHSRKNHPSVQRKKLESLMEEDTEDDKATGDDLPASDDSIDVDGLQEETPPDMPSPLNSLDEPVRQVLEGIREQRMSMCQSLRQYVFMHRAIVEGALQIVDEQKAQEGKRRLLEERGPGDEDVSMDDSSASPVAPVSMFRTPATPTSGMQEAHSKSVSFSRPTDLQPSWVEFSPLTGGDLLQLSNSQWGHKRLASPTELIRTDASGAHASLSKRPSLKRVNKSIDSASSMET